MSRSSGPGSPIHFDCARCRRACRNHLHRRTCKHKQTLTGRSKLNKYAVGVRSSMMSVEYTCECGHTGWSNHADLVDRFV